MTSSQSQMMLVHYFSTLILIKNINIWCFIVYSHYTWLIHIYIILHMHWYCRMFAFHFPGHEHVQCISIEAFVLYVFMDIGCMHQNLFIDIAALLYSYLVVFVFHVQKLCTGIAAFLHYIFLAVFFIMLGEGIQVFIFVSFAFHTKRYRETYGLMAMGWGKWIIV